MQIIKKVLKWEFYSVAAEEMMTFHDDEDIAIEEKQQFVESHVPTPIPKDSELKTPTCMI